MSQQKPAVITKKDIMGAIKMNGPIGWIVSSAAMGLLGFNKVNKYYARNCQYTGPEFSQHILDDIGIKYSIPEEQLRNIPADKPFITISNHAYGGADGLILSSVVGGKCPQFKILTNFLLSMIPTLKDTFLPVNPMSKGLSSRNSFLGIKMALKHIDDGGSLGLFPSGEVASWHGHKYTEEVPWPDNMIKLIRNKGLTVVPIYFDGENSRFFHILGKINPVLRTVRLPRELFNKKGKCLQVRIGKPIPPSELTEYDNLTDLGGYLRARVYALEAQIDKPTAAKQFKATAVEPVADPLPREQLYAELAKAEDKKLFEITSYAAYLLSWDDAPSIMHEIGRTREIAFRRVGEGCNRALDLDEFDRYYKHLVIWNTKDNQLAGAYRLGIGSEIYDTHGGIKAFYNSTLFNFQPGFGEVLKESVELGRSYVASEYQHDPMPLLLLFKGLMHAMLQYPEMKRFVGPVSISNSYPRFYQGLIVKYVTTAMPHKGYESLVIPRTPFQPEWLRVDVDKLLLKKMDTVEKFDRLLATISDGKYRIPTIFRKYIKNNAKIVCFNVDPDFNYSLDGFIVLEMDTFPRSELDLMLRDVQSDDEKATILARFGQTL